MKLRKISSLKYLAAIAGALLVLAAPALAGPPLICHSIDIGTASSLPWTSSGWNLTGQETYDVNHLVTDTLALLAPNTPVLVRMETLRHATLYAQQRTATAKELLARLESRTHDNPNDALAAFDFGYLAESYKQASWLAQHTNWLKPSTPAASETKANPAVGIDGYAWVKKAISMRGQDAEMEFAAALMTPEGSQKEHNEHLQKAMAGAKNDPLLARNIAKRFSKEVAMAPPPSTCPVTRELASKFVPPAPYPS
jgi:hypothetical protein